MSNVWDSHYKKEKSKLQYPDENLVRLLSRISPPNNRSLDFGSGSGRHIQLLIERGFAVSASDSSSESVSQLQTLDLNIPIYLTNELPYSFPKNHFGLIVSWGVFHYNERDIARSIVVELHQAIAPGGYLLGSIRADRDTHLGIQAGQMNLSDLKGGYAETYSLEELQDLLRVFSDVQIGYTERTPLGSLEERICHWFFLAKKT
ncbi:class I SAM-dependent methyltransferase [Leptospira ognonensis]|uniref:Class I SAM-dependent methyltransferase n=1 Tax=Leptospira ognonensis TaxID=2484945 RepID=A0A4R9K9P3_9LEPT|nr:class I SAM-dependent methyltransferase [Leptospira ognonensis]TGL62705.1 class I SAM-dependent methyltransferase [Leptospira ognonensis]